MYTSLQLDPAVQEWDPQAIFTRQAEEFRDVLGRPAHVSGWDASHALRMYDRGECSAAESWRTIASGFAEGMDAILNDGVQTDIDLPVRTVDATVTGASIGNWTLTPDIRQPIVGGSRDRFRFTRVYEISIDFEPPGLPDFLNVYRIVVLEGRFLADADQLRFDLLQLFVKSGEGDRDDVFDPEASADIEQQVNRQLRTTLAQPLTGAPPIACTPGPDGDDSCSNRLSGLLAHAAGPDTNAGDVQPHNLICVERNNGRGECRFVPNIKRVNHRVDGLEVVLSETSPRSELEGRPVDPDAFYTLYRQAGVCNEIQRGEPPIACVQDTIFEVSPENRGDFVCGNRLRDTP